MPTKLVMKKAKTKAAKMTRTAASKASAVYGKRQGLPTTKQPSQRKIEAKKSGAASGGTVRTTPSKLDKQRETAKYKAKKNRSAKALARKRG